MSDDRRKNARTQGKFSDPKEFRSGRRDRQSEKKNTQNQNSAEKNVIDENMESQASKSRTCAEGISVEYQEKSTYSFKELADKKPIQEIREKGVHKISETENGSSRIIYEPNFISEVRAEELMVILRDATKWHSKNIIIHGQEYPQPRLVAWYGPLPYSYSGTILDKAEMPSFVVDIKKQVEKFLKGHNLDVTLNSVLLNFYRNGKDSVSWHSDDELTMGIHPTIASVSLGEIRAFQMRPKPHVKNIDPETKLQVNLLPGSLLIMDGCMQKDWLHQVPKEFHDKRARINLTFRTVYRIDDLPTEVPCLVNESGEPIYSSKSTQPKPIYDSENFPPLMPASNPKSNVSNKANSPSKPPNSLHQTDIDVSREVTAGDESATDPDENDNSSLSNRDADSPFLHDSAMNNLPDTKESFNSKVSPFKEQVNDTHAEDKARDKSDEGLEEGLSPEEEILNSFENSLHVGNEEIKAGCTGGNKHKLNVNAPDFVPGNIFPDPLYHLSVFKGYSLQELFELHSTSPISDDSCLDFGYALIQALKDVKQNNRDYFFPRDWPELEVYMQLTEGGQTKENQRVINDRVCSLVKNAKPKKIVSKTRGRNNPRGYPNRSYHRDG